VTIARRVRYVRITIIDRHPHHSTHVLIRLTHLFGIYHLVILEMRRTWPFIPHQNSSLRYQRNVAEVSNVLTATFGILITRSSWWS
jgi:hypothetical protein